MALKDGTTSKNMLSRGLTSLLDSHNKKQSEFIAAGPAAAAAATAAAAAAGFDNVPLARPKHHATEGRNNLQKHAAPSGFSDCSCWACCCCCCSCCCCWWCCWSWCLTLPSEQTRNQLQSAAPIPSKQFHNQVLAGGCETAKHNGPEGRNDLQKHAVPRLDVPSGSFWIQRLQLLGLLLLLLLLLLLELVLNVSF